MPILLQYPILLEVSRKAASAARDVTFDGLVACVFAAASFEAFLDELAEFAKGHAANQTPPDPPQVATLASLLAELEKDNAQWSLKLQAASIALAGQSLERGAQPYQDLALLFTIRNAVVHSKPATFPTGETQADIADAIVRKLLSRGILAAAPTWPALPQNGNAPVDVPAPWTVAVAKPETARWAVGTVEHGLRHVANLIPVSDLRRRVEQILSLNRVP